MKDTVLFIVMLAFVIFILSFAEFNRSTKVYDCSMADWHPDIPIDVREECRRLRYEHWKREQEESKKKIII